MAMIDLGGKGQNHILCTSKIGVKSYFERLSPLDCWVDLHSCSANLQPPLPRVQHGRALHLDRHHFASAPGFPGSGCWSARFQMFWAARIMDNSWTNRWESQTTCHLLLVGWWFAFSTKNQTLLNYLIQGWGQLRPNMISGDIQVRHCLVVWQF